MLNIKGGSKNEFIRMRVTAYEKELIKNRAEELELSLTDYVRVCINEDLKRNKKKN